MGGNVSTDYRNRKVIEFEIFDNSFALIEKYVKQKTRGLRERYRHEHQEAAGRTTNGYINWHKVMAKHLNHNAKGLGYCEAIQKTGQLLNEAKGLSNGADKQAFSKVYELVDRLIEMREQELDPTLSFCGCVIWGGDLYNSHRHTIQTWEQFKS